MNHRITGPGSSAVNSRLSRNEDAAPAHDDKPVFRLTEKVRSPAPDRPATASGATAHPDGVPGPGQSREEVTERVARGARLTTLRAGHASHVGALNLEGVARRATGTYHHGIMNNPAGRPPQPTPPNVRIVVVNHHNTEGMVWFGAPRDPSPVPEPRGSRAAQPEHAARGTPQPMPSLLPLPQNQVPLASPPSSPQSQRSSVTLSQQVRMLPDVPDEPVQMNDPSLASPERPITVRL